ncbi:probable DNA-directed RNA polymerases I and III subunit RPAC2 [Cimex lectularius]|uniref:DNA-directed RNA polymerases I and III subunit RPAC2 n=1 Tax=Cimex lectularius TaxID=79782 RepID=A0A8I6R9K3_CIMLE|nr:probable DNA-directed RNA polymerases I and III subunit RPAC2 [Cimex lectularius]
MKIAELAGDEGTETSRTFVFYDEGHTFGNVLRCVITSYPEVTFCGYTVPHPAEMKMHLRIQTNGPRAIDILQKGLQDLDKMCDHTLGKFDSAMAVYNVNKMSIN